MPAGIEDVAAYAGVSTATVSRALRGLPNVSEATRQRVQEAADALDYVMSPSASRLASGTTRSIGVVAPYIGRWFFGQLLSGIEAVLRESGYDMLLFALPDDESQSQFFERMPLKRRVDAVMVLTLAMSSREDERLRQLGLPMVTVGDPLAGVFGVGIDDSSAARTATAHLINLGHERIAMIGSGSGGPARFAAPLERQRGYREALADAGLEIVGDYEVDGLYTVEGGAAAMARLLALPKPPTAVFAQSDEMAAGAIKTMRRMGLRYPEDVSIVGFDDHEIAGILDLTTIRQPVLDQGRIAAQHLIDSLNNGAGDCTRRDVPTQLIVRSSTCPPPQMRLGRPMNSRHETGNEPLRRPRTGEER